MKSILVVDDSADSRMIIQMCLLGSPWTFEIAENGREALEMLESSRFDAILMDMEMPVMDGWTCATEIRKKGGDWKSIPIIAMTGHVEPEDIAQCLSSGCSSHLAKPFSKTDLLRALENELGAESRAPSRVAIDPDVAELLPGYFENRRKDIVIARDCLARKDFRELRRIGHNLKGSGPSYGFPQLGELGARIEKESLASNGEVLPSLIDKLETLLSQLQQ